MPAFRLIASLLAACAGASPAAAAEPPQHLRGILEAHNEVRAEVGVPPLRWSSELAAVARDWADSLAAEDCAMRHRPDGRYGENLAWFSGYSPEPAEVVRNCAEEKRHYDYARNRCAPGEQCGHYTQIVWERTERVGCAMARCGREEVWVCNYDPPGNVVGRKPY